MKQKYEEMDPWLREKIDADLAAMVEERRRLLMESEEFQGMEMPMERLKDIHREVEARRLAKRRLRIHRRAVLAVAIVAVACVGMGLVGSGSRLYQPKITENEVGDGMTTDIDNTETKERVYDEENICQEISEKLGVIPVRFSYRPEGIYLSEYWIKEETKSSLMNYEIGNEHLYIFISKNYDESSINSRIDGIDLEPVHIESCEIEAKVIEFQDPSLKTYYSVSFEYLNTYYSIIGSTDKDEFIKILENLAIKNA